MKRSLFILLALSLIVVTLASTLTGCAGAPAGTTAGPTASPTSVVEPPTDPTPGTKMRTIVDMLGQSHVIPTPENIQRVAVIHTPIVQLVYVIGAQDKLCALTTAAKQWWLLNQMDPRTLDMPAPRSGPGNINIEELLRTNPDFCIGLAQDAETVSKNTNIPTLQISINEPGDYMAYQKEEVRFFGRVFGKEDRAEKYCSYLDDIFSRIKAKTDPLPPGEKVKVLCAFWSDRLMTYGGDSYMQEWIELAGCENVAKDLRSPESSNNIVQVTMEQMLSYDPDIVLIDSGRPEDLINHPTWSQMEAVKKGKVYRVPAGIFI